MQGIYDEIMDEQILRSKENTHAPRTHILATHTHACAHAHQHAQHTRERVRVFFTQDLGSRMGEHHKKTPSPRPWRRSRKSSNPASSSAFPFLVEGDGPVATVFPTAYRDEPRRAVRATKMSGRAVLRSVKPQRPGSPVQEVERRGKRRKTEPAKAEALDEKASAEAEAASWEAKAATQSTGSTARAAAEKEVEEARARFARAAEAAKRAARAAAEAKKLRPKAEAERASELKARVREAEAARVAEDSKARVREAPDAAMKRRRGEAEKPPRREPKEKAAAERPRSRHFSASPMRRRLRSLRLF